MAVGEAAREGDQQIAKAVTTKLPQLYRAAMEGNWEVACSELISFFIVFFFLGGGGGGGISFLKFSPLRFQILFNAYPIQGWGK